MSFRRFLYLVADDGVDASYSLRRIDVSRFFHRPPSECEPLCAAAPAAIADAGGLPDPTINILGPHFQQLRGAVHFMLFNNNGVSNHDKVVAMDATGHVLICDPAPPPTVRALPSVATAKFAPFSLNVGGKLYAMDRIPGRRSFETLFHRAYDLRWRPLEPPPLQYDGDDRPNYIQSYTVVAGTKIAMSTMAGATHCFDTAKSEWVTAHDWALPFSFLAEYLPEHKLWFGLSPAADGRRFCAANLVASPGSGEMAPPEVRGSWKEYVEPPRHWSREWRLASSHAVHLGSSKFCIVRFYEDTTYSHLCMETLRRSGRKDELYAVLTAVEVVESGGDEELRVVRHGAERYNLWPENDYWVV
ncbi:hypothetical protein ACP70R_003552 [Stipagrostis hirtigluma subsp. patula]